MGDPLDLRVLLIYRSPSDALKAKLSLQNLGVYAKILPVPRVARADVDIGGCGICVAVEEFEQGMNLHPWPERVLKLPLSVMETFFDIEGNTGESAGTGSR
ncbi:MAG: hypothetical protein PWP37_474 [Thermotogota bacterium]|nr:hypothetical protein [Thermotogota bacterium]MDK2864282.1 hypothetical protein [Thermotogota bacterium]HCZ06620.1 hypothetical protein [Thermotogota bacterium]